ncbi:DUF2786 domain-containing protein [Rhodococcoides kyotonense]|uniref:DUF2786 domain-containing protein n=1 Tax=Rhodococcoides kyotonense TaxID=398843 RepID=A0A239D8C3_9NOCA|nr:DUF2786 domain-containing protein [Rhodococcus kyotonensis]SNS28268.1 Protein of unknown function [Rhodococcus kyotonensis]
MNPVPKLLRQGADASFGRDRDLRIVDDVTDRLIGLEESDALALGSLALTNMIATMYEAGWQPFDLLHIVRRQQTVAVSSLAAAVILHQSDLTNADDRAPESWVEQLSEICALYPKVASRIDASPSFLAALLKSTGQSDYIAASDQWIAVLALLGQWQQLPRWPQIGPLPSQWPKKRTARVVGTPTSADTPNSKALGRIRGLLAKADATDFEEEAETLTAKAQELMTRYSIDSLLLTDGHVDVISRRIHIDNPHAPPKAQLLHVVGEVNRVKAIWDPEFAIATLVGSPVDVEQAELLFTSLLIQATRALSHSPKAKRRKGSASAAFGKAFLYAYAVRIGERLADADAHALEEASEDSGDLLPILAAKTVAVEEEFDRLFPRVRTMRGPRLDAEGWESGQAAANEADLR